MNKLEIILSKSTLENKSKNGYSKKFPIQLRSVVFMVIGKDIQYKEIKYFEKMGDNKNVDVDFVWRFLTIEAFYDKYFKKEIKLEVEIIQMKTYLAVDVKLKKPKQLTGIKPMCSISFNKHCKNQVFSYGDDIYIKTKDYFSPMAQEVYDLSDCYTQNQELKKLDMFEKKKKFIYNDSFGSVILRNSGWLKIVDYWSCLNRISENDCVSRRIFIRDLCKLVYRSAKLKYEDDNEDWYFFFEQLIKIKGEFNGI